MASVDHREEQDRRWATLTSYACPRCHLEVLALSLPPPMIWCGVCPDTPRLEWAAT